MGIINLTPDSFYDGGRYVNHDSALKYALSMIANGADIIDIGGESTRPGAESISVAEEMDRVLPFIERLQQETDCCVSIDTSKPQLMAAALKQGVGLINDINALQAEGALDIVGGANCPVCLMHMQGIPKQMQNAPQYTNLFAEINQFFVQRIQQCRAAGIAKENILLDPGFGFGKTVAHNLLMVKQLKQFLTFDRPILLGVSRKSTIGTLLKKEPDGRLFGSIAFTVYASLNGLGIIRTHDVEATNDALTIVDAIMNVAETFGEEK